MYITTNLKEALTISFVIVFWICIGLKKPRLESKPILQIDKNTGGVIKKWNNSYEPKILGYSASNINMCCNGKRKSANGYIWRFADE